MQKKWDFALLDQTGVLGIALDRDGNIVDWNAGCERATGYQLQEVQGRRLWDLLLPTEEHEAAREKFVERLEGRGPAEFENVWIAKSGKHRSIAWSSTVFAGPDGHVEHVVGIGVDLTDRREADRERLRLMQEASEARRLLKLEQEEARVSEALVTSIVENLPDMVFVKDARTLEFVLFNRAGEELLGWRREDLVGKTDRDFFPEHEAAFFEEKDRQVLTSGALLDIPEESIRTRNGPRILHTKKVAISGSDGQPRYLLGISEDITGRKQAELERAQLIERLGAAVRVRDDVLAIVSHDLKNPVSAILMSTSLLARLALPAEAAVRVHDAVHRIRYAADHMNDLICNLVDAAAIEAGRFSVVRGPQEVEGIVDNVIKMMLPIATGRALRIERRLAGTLPPVDCDRERILQVFSNLIGNAIRFTPSSGSITITAEGAGQSVRFGVADTGSGVTAEALPHLFDRYWRSGRSIRASAGLGLYIVKGIVEAHGGTVWAENPPGGGAAFFFTIPTVE